MGHRGNGPLSGRQIFYHYGADALGGAAPVKISTGNNFLENTREFHKIKTTTGAKFWWKFGPSVLLLVIFTSPIKVGKSKQPLTSVSKRVPGVHGKRGLERGWQKRLAKGWRRVGEGLAQGRRRVGAGLADFLAPSNFGIPEVPV